jgi:alginate O-acetyltransferase complex protein AlgI
MLFNSIQFLIFFVVVTTIYFLLPNRWRWLHLLIASCIFYAYFIPIYILILFFTIIIDYIAGIMIENAHGPKRKWFLVMSLVANVGVLAVFKYYNFFIDNVNVLLESFHLSAGPGLSHLGIILPIGLSFHTFQAMSYTIEVYRGHEKAERHFGIYSLYVMFYPQLVAGPIERPQNVLHQFHENHEFDFTRVVTGLQRILWGLFKKVVVSDVVATYVNSIYNNYELNTGFTLIFATAMFAIQIYCDFSGYSDIALGTARVMGYELMENFKLPYFSKSISEFWKRWHISLSTWFRDYLYISMGGNRVSTGRRYFNLWFTFLISGLWHGASWNFIIWGAIHGTYLIVGVWTKAIRRRLSNAVGLTEGSWPDKIVNVACTFALASLAWVFFRANTFHQATSIIAGMFAPEHWLNLRIQDTGVFAAMLFGISILFAVEFLYLRRHQIEDISPERGWLRPVVVSTVLLLLLVQFGVSEGDQFIYFQF